MPDNQSYTASELFNVYTDLASGNQGSFAGWLGVEMGYDGSSADFNDNYGSFITQFDPDLGLNTALQEYYNATGIDITGMSAFDRTELLNGIKFSPDSGQGGIIDALSVQLDPGNMGSIRDEYIIADKEAKNEFDQQVANTRNEYKGASIDITNQRAQASGSTGGGGVMKSGVGKRQVVDNISAGNKIGSTLTEALEVSREEAVTTMGAELESANLQLRNAVGTQIQGWYNNVMQGIDALANENIWGEDDG
ncbi:MAG: hypothetical protein GOVbin4296_42 [Prokaryotic dsDNA virus sp.]|nr:MAG: hypothetical protein GOVbin4296_42 [Prokaryotic dsDNA virus sp.]|tara:strand:- start:1872 stop:2624 length:753 start_codon:yes stop_codon:yes gene_type:complete